MDRRGILTGLFSLASLWQVQAKDVYVSPGTFSIEKALQETRLARIQEGVTEATVHLGEGVYRLCQPVIVRPEDNGTRIVADGKVVISGGVRVESWRKEGPYYVAPMPEFNGLPLVFRQMWVNGRKAVRARDVQDFERMYRIRSVDKDREIIYVPAEAVKNVTDAKGLEMVLHEMWCVANLRVKAIQVEGDSAAVTFHQPESHIHFMHPWPSPMVTDDGHNSAFYLTGAKALLDTPGEWWLDTDGKKIYYLPLPGEDLSTADVEVPALETLWQVEGTPDRPVKDVTVEGVTFAYTTWLRPSLMGHAPLQAGMYMTEAYKIKPKMERAGGDHKLDNQGWVGRPAAAVRMNAATDVVFQDCTFEHLASTGLDACRYISGGGADRCDFRDIGGTAVLAGEFSPEGFEAHLPYLPEDDRILCTGFRITNNRITDAANEDWGCLGIAAGIVRGIQIAHNEISEVSYSGISLGWGWTRQKSGMRDNRVTANRIWHYARHMYDTAGIYTLGAQPGTVISENVISDIYSPGYVHNPEWWFWLYTDEGSSEITVRDNWTPTDKYLKNANGPGNVWENNGPQVSGRVKAAAGVER